MTQEKVLGLLKEVGAFLTGHFVLKSERHSGQYVNKDAAYPDHRTIDLLCEVMAEQVRSFGIEVVVGPAVAGTILANWVAHHLTDMSLVRAVYADKVGDGFVLKRGYDQIVRGKKCLVVEDIITTGGSVKQTIEAVRACDGEVYGVSAIVNRGGVTPEMLDVHFLYALADIKLETWLAEECPLCRDGVSVNTNVGHGAAFMAKQLYQK